MKASEAYLYKVPWSNAYDNLPFGFETLSDYDTNEKLQEFYGGYRATIAGKGGNRSLRSFRSNNGNITITLKFQEPVTTEYLESNFNYVCLQEDEISKFYFISSFETGFDGLFETTATLTLEYDIYMNNRSVFPSIDPQLCTRTHVKDLTYDSRMGTWHTNSLFTPPAVSVYEIGGLEGLKVCWARITTSGDLYNKDKEKVLLDGCYPRHKMTPVLMFPLFILNTETLEIENNAFWEYDTVTPNFISLQQLRISNIEEIISVDLTYYPPFEYYIYTDSNDNHRIRVQYYNDNTELWASSASTASVYNLNGSPYLYYKLTDNAIASAPLVTKGIIKPIYENRAYLLSGSNPREQITAPVQAKKYAQVKCYPIIYSALYFNNKIYPLLFQPETTQIRYEIIPDEITPYLRIHCGHYSSKPIPLSNYGLLPTASSVYDSYIRANGNKIIAQENAIHSKAVLGYAGAALNAFGASLSTAGQISTGDTTGISHQSTKGFTGVTSGVLNTYVNKEISLNALYAGLNDLKNAQDIFSIPTANAMSAILQDLVLIRDFIFTDDNEVDSVYMDILYYGYEKNIYRSITEATHECYDYVRTANAYFPQIGNLNYRRVMENAFNRGVTLWHFDLFEDHKDDYGNAIPNMNRNVTNIQIID